VVLNVASDQRHSFAANAVGAGKIGIELIRRDLQKSLDGIEDPLSVRRTGGIDVVIDTLKTEAGAQVVPAFGPGKIVIDLRRSVAESLRGVSGKTGADAAENSGDAGNAEHAEIQARYES